MTVVQAESNSESELVVIQQAAKLITQSTDPRRSIQGILRLLSQLLGLNRGRVLLPVEDATSLQIVYSYGLTQEERDRGRYELGEGVTGRVFRTGQTALIQDVDSEPTYLSKAVMRTTLPAETVAYIAVPIIDQEKTVGVLAVNRLRKRDRGFDRDLGLLQIIATFIGQVLRIQQMMDEHAADLMTENLLLKSKMSSAGAAYGIIGESHQIQQSITETLQVAPTKATVLILGESGTGKERFARMLHLASDRNSGPFVSINCAAIPESLIESELFGHEKGAFTGAIALKRGKIEAASGGTLFLDEIGDLDLDLQAKLLKVLEQSVIQRVGSNADVSVDVRIVAATHKHLIDAVNRGKFRLDLFYRLNIFPLRLPPLRNRSGDIPLLVRHFMDSTSEEYGKPMKISSGAMEKLQQYQWPGNIRQLENLVRRAILLNVSDLIDANLIEKILGEESSVMMPLAAKVDSFQDESEPTGNLATSMSGLRPYAHVQSNEVEQIRIALQQHLGNKTRAALSLGMTPRQLAYRIKKLNITL
jgi:Nif-specific regulatory protein